MRKPAVSALLALWATSAWSNLPEVRLELIAEGLNAPIFLVAPPDGSGRRFVGEQAGQIFVIDGDGTLQPDPFLDVSDQMVELLPAFDERGLMGLAFHPGFAENGLFYISYSAKLREGSEFEGGETAYTRRIAELRVSADNPNSADPESERILLELDWVNRKHNGGGLAFGPDGYLYIGLGDGGGVHGVPNIYIAPPIDETRGEAAMQIPEDPFTIPEEFHHFDAYAQDLQRLNGKILRIDVDNGHPGYAIPATNPFAGNDLGLDEIYAWGFRNPFRLAFDPAGKGDMIVNGVAEAFWETIYLVDRPGNYGWAIKEGTQCYDRGRAFNPPETCGSHGSLGEPILNPIVEYPNYAVLRPESQVKAEPLGTASVGGNIYRGSAIPELQGRLIFGDFSATIMEPSGQLFAASPTASWGELWTVQLLAKLDQRLHSLGFDAQGEAYLLTTAQGIPVGSTGKVWKLVPAAP